jgi:hypothetical protein
MKFPALRGVAGMGVWIDPHSTARRASLPPPILRVAQLDLEGSVEGGQKTTDPNRRRESVDRGLQRKGLREAEKPDDGRHPRGAPQQGFRARWSGCRARGHHPLCWNGPRPPPSLDAATVQRRPTQSEIQLTGRLCTPSPIVAETFVVFWSPRGSLARRGPKGLSATSLQGSPA